MWRTGGRNSKARSRARESKRRRCRMARARSAWRSRRLSSARFSHSTLLTFTRHFSPMTESQQQMIDRAFEMLSEHFDHVVIAVGTYDEDKQYTTTASYYGGVAPAIGLCKLYEKRWTKEHLWGPDDEQE